MNKEILHDLYHRQGMSQVEIASRLGVTQKVVWGAMRRLGIERRKAAKRNQIGPANASWRGPDATYAAFHYRVQTAKGKPSCCEVCSTNDPAKHYDWANLTGRYEDVADYKRMCRSCHAKHDGKINNITKGAMPC